MKYIAAFLFVFLLLTTVSLAQPERPVPYPVFTTPQFDRAIDNGTRSLDGMPGANYWTNTAAYSIEAELNPATAMLTGSETIRYQNNSPDVLENIVVHLRQNLHAEGSVRNRPQQLTGGVDVTSVEVAGQALEPRGRLNAAGYRINGTLMTIRLPEPLPAGGSTVLAIDWSFEVPEAGAPRMGQDGEVFYLAYWYPQVAVYDDLYGWKADQYMGNGEFYMDHGSYDVRITAPEGWLVQATGELQNPEEVLSPQTRERLDEAVSSGGIVHIVTESEREAGKSTSTSSTGKLTWHFEAEQVRDFAFGTSDKYVWDATTANAGDRDGDGSPDKSNINAFYRPNTGAWGRSAEFAKFSIEYLSDMFLPYPYPHMTTMEGIIGGGMEFPMLTLIGGGRTDQSLFSVTFHEISHMWFPMIVAQDEKAYTWMDEGLTSFNTNEARRDFWDDPAAWNPERQSYYRIAGTGFETESMRHADQYPYGTPARGIASYNKPAVALHALRGIVGQDAFMEAYRAYAGRWKWKHPTPYDLFNTFEDVLEQDLDWFWTPMFFETWTLDQSVADVDDSGDGIFVTVRDLSLTPMPTLVRVTYNDGFVAEKAVPVETWLAGARETTLAFDPGSVARVEIDPDKYLPDVNRENNVWE